MSEIITQLDEEYYYKINNEKELEPCIDCEWFDKDNLFCDKTHDSLLWGCVCTKRFKNK